MGDFLIGFYFMVVKRLIWKLLKDIGMKLTCMEVISKADVTDLDLATQPPN